MAGNEDYLTVPQVAETLGLHPETVRKLVRQGKLPAFKAGRSWRFDPQELTRWRRRQRARDTGATILVADDAEHIREVIQLTLEDEGHTVVTASTGAGAVVALERYAPDLVLLDLKMPGGSGVNVIRAAKRSNPNLPVIIITGYPDSELMSEALEHSPLLVMAKPVDPDALAATVNKALTS